MHGRRILRHKRGNPDTEVSRSLNSEISLPYSTPKKKPAGSATKLASIDTDLLEIAVTRGDDGTNK